jgi:Tropinone reductase 1
LLAKEPFHAAVRKATPLRRVGEPYEVACTAAFLCMEAAGYITGQVLGIDGGMMSEGFRYE